MVLEAGNDLYYGFDLKNKLERKIAKKIVCGNWSPVVIADELQTGWKAAKELPSLVYDADAWEQFVVDVKDHLSGSRGHLLPEESIGDDISINSEQSGMEQVVNVDGGSEDEEEEEDPTDKEIDYGKENKEESGHDDDDANEESEEEQGGSEDSEETNEKEWTNKSKEDIVSNSDTTNEDNDELFNDKPKAKKQSNGHTLKSAKKSAQFNKSNVDDDMLKNLFTGNLKLEVAENVMKLSKSNSVKVYITGLFCNGKTG